VETKVALLDPKHIEVRTILTYDEVDVLSYPFGGQLSRNYKVADPSSFVKLSWLGEIYHLVQSWHIGGQGQRVQPGWGHTRWLKRTEIGEHVALMLTQRATKALITPRR